TFVSPAPLPQADIEGAQEAARPFFDDGPLQLEFILRSGRRIVPVLTGRENPLESLFPGGSFDFAESLYSRSAQARYVNGLVRALVEAALLANPQRRLRILEIGAGTGSTTAAVLPALPADSATYYFTDLSQLFLSRAEQRFKEYPFIRYGLLDIEKDPAAQGVPHHGIDVVIATNVLHATRDLRQTMRNVRSMLAPGGVLLMNEVTDHPDWLDLTLLEGWERFDDDLRTDSPTLPLDAWTRLLTDSGFEAAAAFPGTSSPAAVLGQHVIVGGV